MLPVLPESTGADGLWRGVLGQPPLELANRDQLLPAAPNPPQLRSDVLGEEVG
jgi:hypothetical protein